MDVIDENQRNKILNILEPIKYRSGKESHTEKSIFMSWFEYCKTKNVIHNGPTFRVKDFNINKRNDMSRNRKPNRFQDCPLGYGLVLSAFKYAHKKNYLSVVSKNHRSFNTGVLMMDGLITGGDNGG